MQKCIISMPVVLWLCCDDGEWWWGLTWLLFYLMRIKAGSTWYVSRYNMTMMTTELKECSKKRTHFFHTTVQRLLIQKWCDDNKKWCMIRGCTHIFLIKIIKKATVEQAVVMVLHVFSFRMTYLQTTAVLACHCHRRVVATTFVLVSLTPDEWHTFLSFCRRDVWNEWWWHRFPCQWLLALLLIHFFLIWHNLACSFFFSPVC